jgi:hypothetical protein
VYQSLTSVRLIFVSTTPLTWKVASAPPPVIVTVSPTTYPDPPSVIEIAVI